MFQRNTIQRSIVLDAVRQLRSHATAEEVYQQVVQVHPSISRATVYRNLQQLSQAGEIRLCRIPGSADRYDHTCTDHYHAYCQKCGKVVDIDLPFQYELSAPQSNAHGFLSTGHDIVFNGICADCQKLQN